ncbi:putative receptor protein kinase ZmPK1 [Camellia sinensis]|uniref:putative receptor protein kinase ZmPK1 n=1 Tax=Camellia sinensis TaxID=4442 RepID=UPI001036846F|nr:putative receptor protein kinase ZmPK1 [Camellia sinensis]
MQNHHFMATPILILIIPLVLLFPSFSFSTPHIYSMSEGSSLSVEKPDNVLISPNGVFSAGFYSVGINAYCFAIWYREPLYDGSHTTVWMANRDQPINGRQSKLTLLKNGNLILTDAGQLNVWATNTESISSVQLLLNDTGNLVLLTSEGLILWQSFQSPTDTLLPYQPLTRNTKLVSSLSQNNYSSGFYKLFFDEENVLSLVYDGLEISSKYWPDPWLKSWEAKRSSYNSSRIAVFNSSGHFKSTDDFQFIAADSGIGIQRRLTMDHDGNIRMYSLDEKNKIWNVTWQAKSQPCKIHGICGPNSLCTYVPHEKSGRRCSCIPGYKIKNETDQSLGCEPNFNFSCNDSEIGFLHLPHVEFYGYDDSMVCENYTYKWCVNKCLQSCNCYGFQYKINLGSGFYNCYRKTLLLNGHRSPSFEGDMYIKLPNASIRFYKSHVQGFNSDCSHPLSLQLDRSYKKPKENGTLQFMVWFASAIGGVEIICICLVLYLLYRSRQNSSATTQSYFQVATGFRKFTYDELKKATRNFGEEIGRGSGGVVYKGVLSNRRVAAIKRLNEAKQGEDEFLAEVSTIGRVNHMNLIEVWGYCVDGKHRLLVYEYMERGSLAENLTSNALDWEKRFYIAVGSAKGLAYLHDECLEWVLHCDVKPQNILLDSNYQPKVADFGLSKLLNRGDGHHSGFSRVRGTRGYMAPEWIFNFRITSKVDVYSYGVVVLEMVTGKSPMIGLHTSDNSGEMEQRGLVKWVREKKNENVSKELWLEEIIDPMMKDRYDASKMEILVEVALQCADEDKDARPTMSQVVERLLHHEASNY